MTCQFIRAVGKTPVISPSTTRADATQQRQLQGMSGLRGCLTNNFYPGNRENLGEGFYEVHSWFRLAMGDRQAVCE